MTQTNTAKLLTDVEKSQEMYNEISVTIREGLETLRNNPRLTEDDQAVKRMIGVVENVIKSLNTLDANINSIDKQFKRLVVKYISDLKKIGENINDPQNRIYYNRVIKSGLFGRYKLNNKNMAMPPLPRMPRIIARMARQVTAAREAASRANEAKKVAKRQQENQARRNAESKKAAAKAKQNANRRERAQKESERREREALEAQERKRQKNEANAVARRLQAQRQRQLNKESNQQKLFVLARKALNKGTALGARFNNANGNSVPAFGGGANGLPGI